jgi:hypothetical protein
MARDFAEMEREFLGSLKAETGKDLAEWMEAISGAGTTDRNTTIDWLKTRGFQFNRASWLERIHSNGGKPVYIDRAAEPRPAPAAMAPAASPKPPPPSEPSSQPRAQQRAPKAAVAAPPPSEVTGAVHSDPAALEAIIASAKGYRPLCNMLLDQIRRLVPAVEIVPIEGYVSFRAPAEFATLNVTSSELRLGLGLGQRGYDALAQKARLKGPSSQMTHMVVLSDARQIGQTLDELVLEAWNRINDEG